MTWQAQTVADIQRIVEADLELCSDDEKRIFREMAINPTRYPINRYGELDYVFVVAIRDSEVLYWEDVEEGFNVSRLGANGQILEHFCNQDTLSHALNAWVTGARNQDLLPGIPIE